MVKFISGLIVGILGMTVVNVCDSTANKMTVAVVGVMTGILLTVMLLVNLLQPNILPAKKTGDVEDWWKKGEPPPEYD